MPLYYADPFTGTNIPVKTRAVSGNQVPAHDVESLPGTVEADIGASKTFLQTLAGVVASSRVAVDLTVAVTGYLQTLAGIVSAGRAAVNVDSTTTGKLDSIISAQAVPAAGPKFGQVGSITTSSNTRFAQRALSRGMQITNLSTTQTLLISHITGPATAGVNTYELGPGLTTPFIACADAEAVYQNVNTGTGGKSCYVGS